MDGYTPIEIWKRAKRDMPDGASRVHYVIKLASGYFWHSTPEFTGICTEESAMAGHELYDSVPIPPENQPGARERLLHLEMYPEPWAGWDNCQHRANWIAFGNAFSPSLQKLVAGLVIAGFAAAAVSEGRRKHK